MSTKPMRTRPTRMLEASFVFLLFGFTGGGTEYLVGVFGKRAKAEIARKKETAIGRTAYVRERVSPHF